MWGDFGGSVLSGGSQDAEQQKEDAEACASREAMEETCGVLCFITSSGCVMESHESLEAGLREKEYVMRLDFGYGNFRSYTMFLVEFKFDAEIGRKYKMHLEETLKKSSTLDLIEKESICLISLQDAMHQLNYKDSNLKQRSCSKRGRLAIQLRNSFIHRLVPLLTYLLLLGVIHSTYYIHQSKNTSRTCGTRDVFTEIGALRNRTSLLRSSVSHEAHG